MRIVEELSLDRRGTQTTAASSAECPDLRASPSTASQGLGLSRTTAQSAADCPQNWKRRRADEAPEGSGGQREDVSESGVAGITPHLTRLFGTVTPEPDTTLALPRRRPHRWPGRRRAPTAHKLALDDNKEEIDRPHGRRRREPLTTRPYSALARRWDGYGGRTDLSFPQGLPTSWSRRPNIASRRSVAEGHRRAAAHGQLRPWSIAFITSTRIRRSALRTCEASMGNQLPNRATRTICGPVIGDPRTQRDVPDVHVGGG